MGALATGLSSCITRQKRPIIHLRRVLTSEKLAIRTGRRALLHLTLRSGRLSGTVHSLHQNIMGVLRRRRPSVGCNTLHGRLKRVFRKLRGIRVRHRTRLTGTVRKFLTSRLPSCRIIIRGRDRLRRLLHRLAPSRSGCTRQLLSTGGRLVQRLSPRSRELFRQCKVRRFNPSIQLGGRCRFTTCISGTFSTRRTRCCGGILRRGVCPLVRRGHQRLVRRCISAGVPSGRLTGMHGRRGCVGHCVGGQFSPTITGACGRRIRHEITTTYGHSMLPAPRCGVFKRTTHRGITMRTVTGTGLIGIVPLAPRRILLGNTFGLLGMLAGKC